MAWKNISIDGRECASRFLAYGGQSMDHYSKSLLELPDGSVKVPTPDLSAIRESILVTPQ